MNERLSYLLPLLESALNRLEDALSRVPDEFLRDAAIQRFEFCFELFWKSIKAVCDAAGVRVYSPRDSFRSAFQMGLLPEDTVWFDMLQDRNLTTHTYSEAEAMAIYQKLSHYLANMKKALAILKDQLRG